MSALNLDKYAPLVRAVKEFFEADAALIFDLSGECENRELENIAKENLKQALADCEVQNG